MPNHHPRPALTLILTALLLLALTACAPAPTPPESPATPPETSAAEPPAPQEPPTPEPPPEPAPEPVPAYHPPIPNVDWERASDLEETWEVHYPAPAGTPVQAPVPGEVVELSNTSTWPWGKYLVIQAAEDTQVRVCHLSEVDAALTQGSQVDHATQIGLAGRTGNTQDCAVGVVVSRKDKEGTYQSVLLSQCDCLLAGPLEGVTYTPPIQGKRTDCQGDDLMVANGLYYRAGSTGLPVCSPVTGVISDIQRDSIWPYGRQVDIQVGEDLIVKLAHLSQPAEGLEIGDPVDSETVVALTGTTGNTSYPTVEVVVRRKNAAGEYHAVSVGLWDAVFENWTQEEFLQ